MARHRFGLAIGTSDALIKAVRRNRLDCAFVAGDEVARPVARDAGVVDEELSYLSVYREELLLLVPPNHPEALRAEDLKITTLAVFPEGCSYRRVLEAWLNTGNPVGKPSWRVMELSSYHTLLACVAAGSCFALCPKSILDRQRSPIDVRTRKIATIDTYLITRSRYRSHAYDALRLALLTTRLAR